MNMLHPPTSELPIGMNVDQDESRMLRRIAIVFLIGGSLVAIMSLLSIHTVRSGNWIAIALGILMLQGVRLGYLRATAYLLCWGMMLIGALFVYLAGPRVSSALIIPLSIMTGGWLLGRWSTMALASAAIALFVWVFVETESGLPRPLTLLPYHARDLFGQVVIFVVAALLSTAVASTLRRQFDKVKALARELQEANVTLEKRVAERSAQLASMQQKVMDIEKLTSLGAMVAGISHELNTPLGNALTVSTTLEAQVRSLAQKSDSGQLTRSALAEFISCAKDMSELTTQSVTRAAGLVASFKQIAVDQTSEQRRTFNLHQVVADNVAAMRPSIRSSGIVIDVNVPIDIECDSYPGPLGQVVTNLLQNAVIHGFAGKQQGRVEISAVVQRDKVCLEVCDDGCGMEPQVQARVFEPFFTTRLGEGGSGLGLSVSHRIASSILGGTLTAQSQLGNGSRFTLTFLKRAPGPL